MQVVGLSVLLAAIEIALYPSLEGPQILFATAAALGVLYVVTAAVAWARRPMRTISAPFAAGPGKLKFSIRRLPVGTLRLSIVATDAAGNTSTAVVRRLVIRRRQG